MEVILGSIDRGIWEWLGRNVAPFTFRGRGCRITFPAATIFRLGGRVLIAWHNSKIDDLRMHDPIATGRRGAMRAVAVSAFTAALAALAVAVVVGARSGLAVAAGAAAMSAGNLAVAAVALRGGVLPAPAALARLVLGALGKWLVVVAVLAVALAVLKLPALPMLAGLVVAGLAYLLALGKP